MGNGIDGISKVTRKVTDSAYNLAAKRVKKARQEEIAGFGSNAPNQIHLPQNGPTVFGWGYGSSSTASTNF